jgi:glutaredoxin
MFLKALRNGLGYFIIFISFFIPIKKFKRSNEEQLCVDKTTQSFSLYQFSACPFCLKTRRAFKRLGLTIETREVKQNTAREELLIQGGKVKVPCLRIKTANDVIWMYESNDIINYLEHQFGQNSTPCDQTINPSIN